MSIQETLQKIKSQAVTLKKPVNQQGTVLLKTDFLAGNRPGAFFALFLAISCGVFFIGRISAFKGGGGEIEVVYPPLVATDIPKYEARSEYEDKSASTSSARKEAPSKSSQTAPKSKSQKEPSDWAFAASKSSKIYYPKDCKGLARVKPENRVYFKTPEQAETAGLTLSKTCKNPS